MSKARHTVVGDKETFACERCMSSLVTVQRDDGTVPLAWRCDCGGTLRAQHALSQEDQLAATHEWVRVPAGRLREMPTHVKSMVLRGELVLQRIGSEAAVQHKQQRIDELEVFLRQVMVQMNKVNQAVERQAEQLEREAQRAAALQAGLAKIVSSCDAAGFKGEGWPMTESARLVLKEHGR